MEIKSQKSAKGKTWAISKLMDTTSDDDLEILQEYFELVDENELIDLDQLIDGKRFFIRIFESER